MPCFWLALTGVPAGDTECKRSTQTKLWMIQLRKVVDGRSIKTSKYRDLQGNTRRAEPPVPPKGVKFFFLLFPLCLAEPVSSHSAVSSSSPSQPCVYPFRVDYWRGIGNFAPNSHWKKVHARGFCHRVWREQKGMFILGMHGPNGIGEDGGRKRQAIPRHLRNFERKGPKLGHFRWVCFLLIGWSRAMIRTWRQWRSIFALARDRKKPGQRKSIGCEKRINPLHHCATRGRDGGTTNWGQKRLKFTFFWPEMKSGARKTRKSRFFPQNSSQIPI